MIVIPLWLNTGFIKTTTIIIGIRNFTVSPSALFPFIINALKSAQVRDITIQTGFIKNIVNPITDAKNIIPDNGWILIKVSFIDSLRSFKVSA